MCGIILAYSKDKNKKETFVSKGLELISHRGQDEVNVVDLESDLRVGHRRLAITGAKGTQPIIDGNLAVLTNGEFYDFKQVKSQFKDYNFQLDSDAEILIPLYLNKSLHSMMEQLNGEFVFAIVDKSKKEIIIARDRVGNKTLYYHHYRDGFFVASEIKAFKSIMKMRFNEDVLIQKLQMQYHHPKDTLFQGIRQIQPSEILIYNYETNKIRTDFYDDLYLNPNSEKLDYEHLMFLLKQSVSRRIDGQNPAIALSGGLDSSIILDLVQEQKPSIKNCFSVSFVNGGIYDEHELVEILAKKYGLNLNVLSLTQTALLNSFEESVYFAEDVTVNLHMPAKFLLFKEMNKKGFKVSLSGEGSDEFFLGYSHFFPYKDNYLKGMHLPDKDRILTEYQNLPLFLEAKLSIGHKIQSLLSRHHHFRSHIQRPHHLDSVSQASYLWSKYALSNSILVALGDKMEMASTIEGRTPFLDRDLLKYVMGLRTEDKIKLDEDKTLLRTLFRNRLPAEIVNRTKHPFIAPPLLNSKEGIGFFKQALNAWDSELINKEKVNEKLESIYLNNNIEEQRLYDPVFMILVSIALLDKRMNHD